MTGVPTTSAAVSSLSSDTEVASAVKALMAAGEDEAARECFAALVVRHQRRALGIAFGYLRDSADADEATQDAFVKAYSRLSSYREEWPFEVWFTRILVNGCLDRLKARQRRGRWMRSLSGHGARDPLPIENIVARGASPEDALLAAERHARLRRALGALPERQRTVFVLTYFGGRSPREVAAAAGLTESTVRVHLFRAVRRLRHLLANGESRGHEAAMTEQRR